MGWLGDALACHLLCCHSSKLHWHLVWIMVSCLIRELYEMIVQTWKEQSSIVGSHDNADRRGSLRGPRNLGGGTSRCLLTSFLSPVCSRSPYLITVPFFCGILLLGWVCVCVKTIFRNWVPPSTVSLWVPGHQACMPRVFTHWPTLPASTHRF